MSGSQPQEIGTFNGFKLDRGFDPFSQELYVALEKSGRCRVTLGADGRGNITRIENALAGLPQRLSQAQAQLEDLHKQVAEVQQKLGQPFPQEQVLQEKSARLVELNALLDMPENEPPAQDIPDKPKAKTIER